MQNVDLVGIAQLLLLEMAKEINEVIHLVVCDGLFGVYIAKIELEIVWQESNVEKLTPFTIMEFSKFVKEIEKVKAVGAVTDEQGVELYISCISVSIRNHENNIIAAIIISHLTKNIQKQQYTKYQKTIKKFGEKISEQLGNYPTKNNLPSIFE